MFDRFVSAAYPFLDAVLLGVVVQAIVSRRVRTATMGCS